MSNFYFRCDNCGRETNGITSINGMKFCAKCYQETFGNNNQQNEIQQYKDIISHLRKALDFKNEKVGYDVNEMWSNLFIDSEKQNRKLKQQIEEKDKEIADLEKENGILTNLLATKPTEIELDELYTQLKQLKEKDKEKKQFAISKLEKVKAFALSEVVKFTSSKEYLANQNLRGLRPVNYYDLQDCIDNQIKEVRGE